MSKLQPVRGTKDLLLQEIRCHRYVEEEALRTARLYGFNEIATPIFEFTEVFKRTLGDVSDIVAKEMYTFEDRSGESITLRPEGTAGIARALVSNGLFQTLPLKVFYRGPMFRYERPQKGRYRQFHQFGIELLGVPTPQADIEVIALGAQILDILGLKKRITLELNTLGDHESRTAYRKVLMAYLNSHLDGLSDDSKQRFQRNPLRILDSKNQSDQKIVANAPVLKDYLNDNSRAFFETLQNGLTRLGINFKINPHLVRGLDYYCHTTFEFTTTELGTQSAILAGGRYDNLIEMIGGPKTPGVGWAAGIERLALLVGEKVKPQRLVAMVPLGERAQEIAVKIAHHLRISGIGVDMGYSGNLKKRLKRANTINARIAVILGDNEIVKDIAIVRDLDTGDQTEIPLTELKEYVVRST